MTGVTGIRYRVVDVFTSRALEGNPLAVFPDARGISDSSMQRIARELNLSETAFILPSTRPDCAARVRIFTPAAELPFAGHPTLGSAWVILNEGIVPSGTRAFTLEERVGPIAIRIDDDDPDLLWLSTPPISFAETFPAETAAHALGLALSDLLPFVPQVVSAGNPILMIAVRDIDAVDRSVYHPAPGFPACVMVFTPTPTGAYSRMFAPSFGVPEDPATGSAAGPLAATMFRHSLTKAERLINLQGVKMGRPSQLHIHLHAPHAIDVGGHIAAFAECLITTDVA